MKKIFTASIMFIIFSMFTSVVFSAPAIKEPYEVEQPNGDKIELMKFGDEWRNGITDTLGNIVLCDSQGYYRYVTYQDETVDLSIVLVGEAPPENAMIKKTYMQLYDESDKDPLLSIKQNIKEETETPIDTDQEQSQPEIDEPEEQPKKNWFESLVESILNFFINLFGGRK